MDDPDWSWPAWKFGMKREDLSTKLHDQYNTFPSSIQDPEAFHHDVFEVAITASTTDEFHELMSARKQKRLQELDESLEAAAFEIIAHPKLVGTEQWQYALQLFRTRSLDSLVRYFSSYLPESYLDRQTSGGNRSHTPLSTASSYADYSSVASATTDPSSIDADDDDYDDREAHALVPTFLSSDKPVFTDEPEDIVAPSTTSYRSSPIDTHIPLSPESIVEDPDTAASSPVDTTDIPQQHTIHSPKPKRPMTSFANADSDVAQATSSSSYDEICPPLDGAQTPAISEADLSDSRSSVESISFSGSESGRRNSRDFSMDEEEEEEDEGFPITQSPIGLFDEMEDAYNQYDRFTADIIPTSEVCDVLDSETPTPRPEGPGSCSFQPSKSVSCSIRSSSVRLTPSREARSSFRSESPLRCTRRTPEEAFSRIQKPVSEPFRARFKGKKRFD
ncbi:hypothetical protein jhhlp_005210 [Lomentospora prolificans]|uniref:Uncharacterized protein n=1 Tax=Lomentospora prolificans TaxID=41688 RepID=A0A2N3N788_9PEZI|nr:hypothetical protein jhhlp_005210 [Lomentospora prolificans]